jgi:death-on-curing protein
VTEPRWIGRTIILAIHNDQLDQHGGMAGLRDAGSLESALDRARNRYHYQPDADLSSLAAAYGFAIATAHPFFDGNKRTAFMCMYTFLGLNGFRIVSAEAEVVTVMIGVADGTLKEDHLAEWLRTHTQPW